MFIIFPLFSANLISIIIGISVLIFGIGLAYSSFITHEISGALSSVMGIFGIVMIIFGLCFIFAINAISFLVGLQFYIVAFMLIMIAVVGFLSDSNVARTGALLYLVLGIVILLIAMFAAENPILITIILGVILIAQGIMGLIYGNEI
ncbi:hypothetical protein mru_1946 [Methanobrevibacter ruminantium M1]|uniref:Uncharacterized protein n=2 Tax=Methanobrevibacter ruminantium TaxID=83816 RepID=D3E072_METRM|nr:hypothetical protein mru_1946 [Methanobrevibacter ruminantium M1]